MNIASPAVAHARVRIDVWQRFYEGPFRTLEDDLAHTRIRLLSSQNRGDRKAMSEAVEGWRTLLEKALRERHDVMAGLDLLVRKYAFASWPAASRVLRFSNAAAVDGIDPPFWSSPNTESVLVDVGAGITAFEVGVHADNHRRRSAALAWWRCAAATGHARAAFELGQEARIRCDIDAAISWWRQASLNGHEEATRLLDALKANLDGMKPAV